MTSPSGSPALAGVRVAVFEARMAGTVADMLARHGAIVLAAPALWEIPLGESPDVTAFAETLTAGGFDVVIFETGAGVRYLAQAIETRTPRETWIGGARKNAGRRRGPKPIAALRELGARVDFQVPSPNTWHETLGLLDEQLPAEGLRVAVQEYGAPNAELVEGLVLAGRPSRRCGSIAGRFPRISSRCEKRSPRSRWAGLGSRCLHRRSKLSTSCRSPPSKVAKLRFEPRWRNTRWSAQSGRRRRKLCVYTACRLISSRPTPSSGT